MLSENCRELLTAYVDGELTARQQKAVLRLLQQSTEARDLLRQMQQDADALRQLPRVRLDRDLSAPVAQIIAERRLQPGARRRRSVERLQPNLPAWAGFSAAAAALLLVAFGSYLYFSWSLEDGQNPSAVAKSEIRNPKSEISNVKPPAAVAAGSGLNDRKSSFNPEPAAPAAPLAPG